MSRVEAALRRIGRDLGDLGRWTALVGGLAVSARTEPRFTRDADLAVLVNDDRDAATLVRSLQARSWRVLAAVEQEATARLGAVRLSSDAEVDHGVVVDLLFASSGIEPEIVAAAESVEILPGVVIPVAQLGHLIALKVLARDDRTRPQDVADLVALLATADAEAIALARDALALVVARGFHRRRDLLADLDAALADPGPRGSRDRCRR
ncbi:MAG: nucleotidyl transferase AbiEii/AbiGii toxin family protein [Candidatus Rokubacteria bacterium]|nr:nucleotidyl transferase AbiEii/AbiGii toxin family protein [Candidatus Rokubacteria bacterium]